MTRLLGGWCAGSLLFVLAACGGDSRKPPEPPVPECGNGVVEAGEACDDGNTAAADGCDTACVPEAGFRCPPLGGACVAATCGDGVVDDGEDCDGGAETATCDADCTAAFCGDGQINTFLFEACDDGNAHNGDGCDAGCDRIEPGWACPTPGEACHRVGCGNGELDTNEACDDGDLLAGDGCSSTCTVEPGWTCAPAGCRRVVCGDSVVDAPEVCDDGNAHSGDGCRGDCRLIESGFGCDAVGCHEIACGDGFIDAPEVCDDGNTRRGDGCSDCSAVDDGWACPAANVDCHLIVCGDGVVDPPEACDDGNADRGDGCTDCSVDAGSACPAPGVACHTIVCGDDLVDAPDEQCDGGNADPGDGCGATCQLEGDHCANAYDLTTLGDAGLNVFAWSTDSSFFQPDYDAPCSPTAANPDIVAEFVVPQGGDYDIFVTSAFDSVLWAWDGGCGANAPLLGCADDFARGGEYLPLRDLAAGQTLYIGVDGWGATIPNRGELILFVVPVVCGDSILAPTEGCDDGNVDAGDGCSPACVPDGADCTVPFDLNAAQRAQGVWVWDGDTATYTDELDAGSCVEAARNGDGVAQFTAPTAGAYVVEVQSEFDSVLRVLDACSAGAGGLACADATTHGERTSVSLAAGETVFIAVDGWGLRGANAGGFTLRVFSDTCGDGAISPNEACDDGNATAADGCTACQLDAGWACDIAGEACRQIVCGDGLLDPPELCDDHNTVPGDGCDASCVTEGSDCNAPHDLSLDETGHGTWMWLGDTRVFASSYDAPCAFSDNPDGIAELTAPATGTYVFELAAEFNSVLAVLADPCSDIAALGCDDVAGAGGEVVRVPLDAGDTVYVLVDGYGSLSYSGGAFALTVSMEICGDGVLDAHEACDDASVAGAGPGCADDCSAVEPGWECPTPGAPCVALCGNGELDSGEACDDGGTKPYDGCSDTCTVELGWVCEVPGNPCRAPYCSDGIIDPPEVCDDGNWSSGDGCSADCLTLEPGWHCEIPGKSCVAIVCGNSNIDWTESCEDGNTSDLDGCSSACQLEIAAPLSSISVKGTLAEGDRLWSRPNDRCAAIDNPDRPFDAFWIVNHTGAQQWVEIAASFGGNGFLHVYSDPFDPERPGDGCLAGNDDNGDTSSSRLLDVAIADGQTLVIVASSFDANDFIGDYMITVTTNLDVCGDGQRGGAEECDDGNTEGGDGCAADCASVEDGYVCDLPDFACVPLPGALVINEVDYDQVPGAAAPDDVEFVEIFNNTDAPVSLTSLELVLVDSFGVPYLTVPLGTAAAELPAGGYLAVHDAGLGIDAGAISLPFTSPSDNIDDGVAGVALVDSASETLLDALSYEDALTAVDLGFAAGAVSLVEGTPTLSVDDGAGVSLCRRASNGRDLGDAASDWSVCVPSAGAANP